MLLILGKLEMYETRAAICMGGHLGMQVPLAKAAGA